MLVIRVVFHTVTAAPKADRMLLAHTAVSERRAGPGTKPTYGDPFNVNINMHWSSELVSLRGTCSLRQRSSSRGLSMSTVLLTHQADFLEPAVIAFEVAKSSAFFANTTLPSLPRPNAHCRLGISSGWCLTRRRCVNDGRMTQEIGQQTPAHRADHALPFEPRRIS